MELRCCLPLSVPAFGKLLDHLFIAAGMSSGLRLVTMP